LLIGTLPELNSNWIDTRPAPCVGADAKPAEPIGYSDMSPRPHEGPAEEGLSSSFLPIVQDREKVECLRTVLSGFCHRCRNSLNGIKMGLYLFRREAMGAVPHCWGELESIYHEVEHLFDHLQTIYRPMSIAMIRSHLDELIDHLVPRWRSWFESRGRSLRLDPPECEVTGDFDPARLGVGLDAMAAWRAEAADAGRLTRIAWSVRDGSIEICWEEAPCDEPPVPLEHVEGLTGRNGSAASRRVDALALPLLARIVAEHGGRLCYTREPWLIVRLRLPQFHPTEPGDAA
jgi:hypothetical protein